MNVYIIVLLWKHEVLSYTIAFVLQSYKAI